MSKYELVFRGANCAGFSNAVGEYQRHHDSLASASDEAARVQQLLREEGIPPSSVHNGRSLEGAHEPQLYQGEQLIAGGWSIASEDFAAEDNDR